MIYATGTAALPYARESENSFQLSSTQYNDSYVVVLQFMDFFFSLIQKYIMNILYEYPYKCGALSNHRLLFIIMIKTRRRTSSDDEKGGKEEKEWKRKRRDREAVKWGGDGE